MEWGYFSKEQTFSADCYGPLFLKFVQHLLAPAVERPRAREHGRVSNKPQEHEPNN